MHFAYTTESDSMPSSAPTSFNSSMFRSDIGTGPLIKPGEPILPAASSLPASSDKHKKHKKEKKKKKKKHKHKHDKERKETFGGPGGAPSFSLDHLSSGRSNTNSPYNHPPDSPEFEVL